MIADKPKLLESYVKHLLLKDPKDLHYFMLIDRNGDTPLDIAIKKNQIRCVQGFLQIMIHHSKDKKYLDAYNEIIDNYLISFIKLNIDLKELMCYPEILMRDIKNHNFPDMHFSSE